MIRHRLEHKPAFTVTGVKTWISGQHNEEFAAFWQACTADGTCGRLQKASLPPASNVTHSRIMGVSRVEKNPDNRAFDFYIASETDAMEGLNSFSIEGGEWAIFEGDGDDAMALIRAEMEAFMHWLPTSGYVHDHRPEIEVYPEGTGVYVEFWLPVRKGERMFTDLETERLLLRCISDDDADFFYSEFSNDDVNRYLYDAEPCASVGEAKEWIAFYLEAEPRDHHRWVIVLKESGQRIGTCGFHCWDRASGAAEIGYDLLPQYWQKGYATEAISEIIHFARTEMHVNEIYAHISVDNTASAKTAEKLGFIKTGETYYESFHGREYLHDIYALKL